MRRAYNLAGSRRLRREMPSLFFHADAPRTSNEPPDTFPGNRFCSWPLCARQATATEQPAATAAETPRTEGPPAVTFPLSPNPSTASSGGTRLGDVKDMTVVEKNGPAAYAKIPGMSPRLGDIP
jgi:hypothetical protein